MNIEIKKVDLEGGKNFVWIASHAFIPAGEIFGQSEIDGTESEAVLDFCKKAYDDHHDDFRDAFIDAMHSQIMKGLDT